MVEWGLTPEEKAAGQQAMIDAALRKAQGPSLRDEVVSVWPRIFGLAYFSFLAIAILALTHAKSTVITVHPPVLFSGAVVLDSAGAPISNVLSPKQAEREVALWRTGTKHAANAHCPCSTLLVSVIATLPDSLTHKR